MIQTAVNFIFGSVRLEITHNSVAALNALMIYNINYWDIERAEDMVKITVPWASRDYVGALFEQFAVSHKAVRSGGIPSLFKRYRARSGMIAGVFLFAFLLWSSTLFVWNIEISGNDRLSDVAILEELRDAGCFVGAFRPGMDLDSINNRYLLASDGVSWMTINFDGTTARVQITEYDEREYDPDMLDDTPSMLIATREGQIERLEVSSGLVVVDHGSVVTPGQVLVTGLITNAEGHIIDLRAATGRVFARTWRELIVTVPFEAEMREVADNILVSRTYNIFTREVKVYSRSGNLGENYDIMMTRRQVVLFGFIQLPIWVVEEVAVVYEYRPRQFDEASAREMAIDMLAEIMADELRGAQILNQRIEETITEMGLTRTYYITVIENIARRIPLDIRLPEDMSSVS